MSGSYRDNDILQSLLEDPTRSDNEIAGEIGTYRQKVWREKKKLERENVIWGYTTIIDEHKLNRVIYVLLIKMKPISKEYVDLSLSRVKERVPKEMYGIRVISLLFVNGEYDWMMVFSAPTHQEAKRYYESIRKEYENYLTEKPTLLDVPFALLREGKLNPESHKLYEFVP
jgi:DNA-binding Lrp family transcriptional regulator